MTKHTYEDCDPDCDERALCVDEGTPGHMQCGLCIEHEAPRHHCGCLATDEDDDPDDECWPVWASDEGSAPNLNNSRFF